MKLELELGWISSVHKLVQFWCVIVGRPLGCQLSYYLENLEWGIVTKLGHFFVQCFQSLWWKVLNSCTLPCGLLNTHWSQFTQGNDMFSTGGDPIQTQDPHVSSPWRGPYAELRPKAGVVAESRMKTTSLWASLEVSRRRQGLTPSPAWWFLTSCGNVTFQKSSSWGDKGVIGRTQWDVPLHPPWIICDNTLAGVWKHRGKKKDERELESTLSPVIARALKMPKDLFDCTLFEPYAILLLLIHVLERSLKFCWKYIFLLAKSRGIFSRKIKGWNDKNYFFPQIIPSSPE